MTMITQRRITPEHMDDPHATRAELAEALHYLRQVNRRLGGTAAALQHLQRWARDWPRDETIRIIDIATGAADIPVAIADWAKRTGHRVHITAVDLHPVTIELAKEYVGRRDDIEIRQADARRLMDIFPAGAFQYAHAGLFLHHLPDIEVMTVLRIMDRLTTHGLIWNDLVRGWISRIGVRLATIGIPQHVRHDALVSIEAGFTRREAIDLAQRAGLHAIAYRRHLLHRFTLTSEKSGAWSLHKGSGGF